MPSTKTLVALGSIAALALITFVGRSINTRSPKLVSLRPQISRFHSTAKIALGVEFRIEQLTEEPSPQGPIDYKISLSRQTGPSLLAYEFVTDEMVEVVSPSKTGQINFGTGHEAQIRLQVLQSSDQDRRITLLISDPISSQSNAYTFSTLSFHQKQKEQEELIQRMDQYHQDLEAPNVKK